MVSKGDGGPQQQKLKIFINKNQKNVNFPLNFSKHNGPSNYLGKKTS